MSSAAIKQHLKDAIDKLSPSDARLADKDLNLYFEYLQERRKMPKNKKLSFEQYQQLTHSLQQVKKGDLISARKVFTAIRKKYGFNA